MIQSLSVVIPVYNEEDNIKKCVQDVYRHVLPDAEVIIVNDCSTDSTLYILKQLQKEYNSLKVVTNARNMGHGATVVKGLKLARNDYILYIDADRQIDLTNMEKLYDEQVEFASGYRVDRHDKPFRLFITRVLKYTNLIRHFHYIKDANCPFKLYKRQYLELLFEYIPNTYVIPIACIEVLARKYKYRTKEVPTYHREYEGVRAGFLQSINRKSIAFCKRAFFEIIRL